MISKTSQHKDLAAKSCDYFTSPEIQSEHAGKLNTLISPTKAARPPADMSDLAKKFLTTTMGDYDAIYLPTDQALSADLVTKYFEVTDGVALGSVDPATAGATMQGTSTRPPPRHLASRARTVTLVAHDLGRPPAVTGGRPCLSAVLLRPFRDAR